jgi:hypothetical protein
MAPKEISASPLIPPRFVMHGNAEEAGIMVQLFLLRRPDATGVSFRPTVRAS